MDNKAQYILQLEYDSGEWYYTLFKGLSRAPTGFPANNVFYEWDGGVLTDEHGVYPFEEAVREIRLFHDIKETDDVFVLSWA